MKILCKVLCMYMVFRVVKTKNVSLASKSQRRATDFIEKILEYGYV